MTCPNSTNWPGIRRFIQLRHPTVIRPNRREEPTRIKLMPTIKELQAAGCESLRAIAAALNERGIPTARGGKWSSPQVLRVLEAANPFVDASAAVAA